ncbi:hypothetical protein B0T19DRAFT_442721 [Cercophora scortea]|uniref:Uncharacterized protein n=1 Tax=Cercophora scortea TaxID=314031 RepID=A0AAE0M8V9_9PEZI|nr:hypothetical protein B0T19DRAFT_442721 [Cercophora scortea]
MADFYDDFPRLSLQEDDEEDGEEEVEYLYASTSAAGGKRKRSDDPDDSYELDAYKPIAKHLRWEDKEYDPDEPDLVVKEEDIEDFSDEYAEYDDEDNNPAPAPAPARRRTATRTPARPHAAPKKKAAPKPRAKKSGFAKANALTATSIAKNKKRMAEAAELAESVTDAALASGAPETIAKRAGAAILADARKKTRKSRQTDNAKAEKLREEAREERKENKRKREHQALLRGMPAFRRREAENQLRQADWAWHNNCV